MKIAALGLAFSLSIAGLGAAAAVRTTEFRFEKLNRVYADFVPPLEGMERGGVTVKLASPRQTLILRDHRVRLTPRTDGALDAALELDIQGKGALVADVTLGTVTERFNDEVVVPPQTLKIAGRVKIRRLEGGYEVAPVELPANVQVAIQSKTVNQILELCDNASLLTLGAIDCAGLDRALTRPTVPLPSGQSFTLADADLSDENRRVLDELLGGL